LKKAASILALGFALASQAAFAQVEVSLQVGATKYQASGQGQCKAAPQASIYGINAALYLVSHRSDGQSLNLSLWQPKDGAPNMLSLRVSTGSKQYLVDTVKGGTKRDPDGSLQRSAHRFPRPFTLRPLVRLIPGLRERSLLTWSHDRARTVGWVKGAALAIRRTAFDAVGGFDPSFFMYFEETDLSARLAQAGWETHFTPATSVVHAGGASTDAVRADMAVQFYSSMRRFYARHYAASRLAQLDVVLKVTMRLALVRDRMRRAITRDASVRARLSEDIRVWQRVLNAETPSPPAAPAPGSR